MTAHFTLPREVALDTSGNPVSGAKLYFFDVGTTNPRTVYQDFALTTAHGVFVQADANGVFDPIYPPNGDYDVLMTDGSDSGNDYTAETVIRAKISTQGPVDLTAFQTTSAKSETPAITKATDYAIVEADRGKALDVNPNSATVTITLESAAVAGDGTEQTIKHIGTSNAVLVSTVGGELIDEHSELVLARPGATVTLRSDGANWKIKSLSIPDAAILHAVASRTLVSPPASPETGNKYIMSDGTLMGQWSGYSTGDLVIYAGSGGYQLIDKMAGDRAYIIDENMDIRWSGIAWEDLSNITAPSSSNLKAANFQLRKSTSSGGSGTTTTWTAVKLNYEHPENNIDDLSFDPATYRITIPSGTYLIQGSQTHVDSNGVQIALASTTTSTIIESCNAWNDISNLSGGELALHVNMSGILKLDAEEVFEFRFFRNTATGATDLGYAISTGGDQVYAVLDILDLSSLQGPRGEKGNNGDPGSDGNDGVSGLYTGTTEPVSWNDGDLWIRSSDGQLFKRVSGTAVDQGYSMKGPIGNTGPVGMNWTGPWSNSTAYVIDDSAENNGSTYICTADHTNQEPPNATYWDLVSSKGADGAGSGDLVGPATATDNSVARFDSTTGKLVQNSIVIIDDSGNVTGVGTVDGRDLATDGTKLDGIESSADVTDTANVTAAGALMESEIDANLKTLALPANTTISTYGGTLIDDADAAAARTTLGVDPAGTDNSTDVTFTGSGTYISLSGQQITVDQITESDITDLGSYLESVNVGDISVTSEARGDILIRGASGWERLPAGASGQFLKTLGASADLEWATIAGGGDMLASNNLSDLSNAATSRENLGVSPAAEVKALKLRVAALEGDALGYEDGIEDPFNDETDVDTASSLNESYDSSNDLYTPMGGVTEDGGHSVGSAASGTYTWFDRSWSLDNSSTVIKIGVYATTAQTVTVKIAERVSAGSYDIVKSEAFSHGGAGWEDFMLTTPYIVPASGDFYAGEYATTNHIRTSSASVTRAFVNGSEATGAGFALTETSGNTALVRATYAALNMTLQSDPFTADSAPSKGRLLFLIKPIDIITINTDAIGAISRDGGTTFTNVILADTGIKYGDGTKVYESVYTDISSQPSGTSMKWKFTTANNKNLEVSGVILQWS